MFGKSKGKSKRYAVGDIIEPLLEEERSAEKREMLARIGEQQQMEGSAAAHSAAPAAPDAPSSISFGLSIVGKIVGNGRLAILGHVEGEVHASTVQIGDGAQVEGNIIAEEWHGSALPRPMIACAVLILLTAPMVRRSASLGRRPRF